MPPYIIRILDKGKVIELSTGNGRDIDVCQYHDTIGEIKKMLRKNNSRNLTIFSDGKELDDNLVVDSDITLLLVEYECLIDKLIYIENILPTSDFNRVKHACGLLDSQLKLEKTDRVVRKIISLPPPGTPGYRNQNNTLYDIFYGNLFLHRLKKILGFHVSPSNIPIDYRVYEIGGSMEWHRDTIINPISPQIEVVFTLENESDSTTEWLDESTNEIHAIWTYPNSVVITQGGGAYHRVLPVKKGTRSIVKIAYNL